jgi:23S rRNA (adenine2030-N6)-methyltransferase
MNYRHLYHAGNFADVFKHIVLTALLQAMQRKPKPFCYMETHAGAGKYALNSTTAHKTQEFEQGIKRLWHLTEVPELIANYLNVVKKFNPANQLLTYPGSPCVARQLLRPEDRMVLCELQSEVFAQLRQEFSRTKQAKVYLEDGYDVLKAVLPPLERRGVVLIDPSFEQADEFKNLVRQIRAAHQRWETGVYALWYPIKSQRTLEKFQRDLVATGIKNILTIQLYVYPNDVELRLNGAGVVIINPPYQLDSEISQVLPWLCEKLAIERGSYSLKWLTENS